MDSVEILLLLVVGFSVLVFLFVDNCDSIEEKRKSRNLCDSESKTRAGTFVDDQEEKKFEKKLISDDFSIQETELEAEIAVDEPGSSGGFNFDNEYFDDWEGIERTELEKIFGQAVVFVSHDDNSIDGDLKLQLYGLQNVVFQGPCHGPQPMALKVSARAKWNAWQKLGNLSREMAMENYVDILTKAIPGWKGEGAPLAIQEGGASKIEGEIQG